MKKRKRQLRKMKSKLSALSERVAEIESKATVDSFYFGKLDFPSYVQLTEKEMNRLKNDKERK